MPEPITEDWLQEVGFKWHQLPRQPSRHWLLWLGDAIDPGTSSYEDVGLELAAQREGRWYCWIRGDTAHRYHRFIHIRYVETRAEVIQLVEALTGRFWDPENNIAGSMRRPEDAKRIRGRRDRFDHQVREQNPRWYEVEEDDTRGRALPEHMEECVTQEERANG